MMEITLFRAARIMDKYTKLLKMGLVIFPFVWGVAVQLLPFDGSVSDLLTLFGFPVGVLGCYKFYNSTEKRLVRFINASMAFIYTGLCLLLF